MVLTLLSLVACSDYDLKRQEDEIVYMANIKVTPDLLSYGDIPAGETALEQFNITNIGNIDLNIDSVIIEGAASFTLLSGAPIGAIAPEEQVTVTVAYEALEGESAGVAVVHSDDPDSPEVEVELIAGVSNGELRITPNPYDFGVVSVGSTANGTVEISNVGAATVTLDELAITSGPFDAWFNEELPASIPGGETSIDTLAATGMAMNVLTDYLHTVRLATIDGFPPYVSPERWPLTASPNELPPAERGWLDAQVLADMAGLARATLNVYVQRLRRQIADCGVIGVVIDRRANHDLRLVELELDVGPL